VSDTDDRTPPRELVSAAVEAVIFAAGEPVKISEIVAAFGLDDEAPVVEALEGLREEYEQRQGGLSIERVAGGFRLATRSAVGAWVRQFFRQRNRTRLTPAGLETLAIVAYRQPITAPEIQAIRGVDPSGTLRSLLEKRMIRILGKKKVIGSPFLYGTTRDFLVHFGLDDLEDLPSLEEFEEILGGLGGISEEEIESVDASGASPSADPKPAESSAAEDDAPKP